MKHRIRRDACWSSPGRSQLFSLERRWKKWAVVRVSTFFTEDILCERYLDQNVQNQLIIVNTRQVEAFFRTCVRKADSGNKCCGIHSEEVSVGFSVIAHWEGSQEDSIFAGCGCRQESVCVKTITALDKIPQNIQCMQGVYILLDIIPH